MTVLSIRRRFALVLVIVLALACRARSQSDSLERRFDAVTRTDRAAFGVPERVRAAIVGAAYDTTFTPEYSKSLSHFSDHDLDMMFRAAQLAAWYSLNERYIGHMRSTLDELQHRGRALTAHYVQMQEVLVKARMLTEAVQLAKLHPGPELEPVPEFREAEYLDPDLPTEWVVDPTLPEVLRRSVDLRNRVTVVVVSHPECHFSAAAMRDIQADAVLSELFSAHARWLAPQNGHFDLDVVQRWNRDHPGQETTLTYRRDEWPMIDTWSTPTFYFLEDGVVTSKVVGWPKDGRRVELLEAFRQLGLVGTVPN